MSDSLHDDDQEVTPREKEPGASPSITSGLSTKLAGVGFLPDMQQSNLFGMIVDGEVALGDKIALPAFSGLMVEGTVVRFRSTTNSSKPPSTDPPAVKLKRLPPVPPLRTQAWRTIRSQTTHPSVGPTRRTSRDLRGQATAVSRLRRPAAGRRSAVPPPGFLNMDWRSDFADSNPSWLGGSPALVEAERRLARVVIVSGDPYLVRAASGRQLVRCFP